MNTLRRDACPLCFSKNVLFVGTIDYKAPVLFSTIEIRLEHTPLLYECEGCRSWFTENIVRRDTAFEMYSHGQSCDKWPRSVGLAEEKSEKIIHRLDQYLKIGRKVLDVGCNTGILLDYARTKGCDTTGVEPSSASREILRIKGHSTFDSMESVTGKYDVITAFDLVEHLYDVPGFFKSAANLLRSDGVILLLTGDIHSLSARLSKENWWYLKYPEHIVFPSRTFLDNIDDFTLVSMDRTYASVGYHRSVVLGVAQYIRMSVLPGRYEGLPSLGPDHILVALRKRERGASWIPDTCVNCGERTGSAARRFSLSDRRKGLPGDWQLVECDRCGVIAMTPMPTDEELATYYAAYSKDSIVDLSQGIGSRYPKLRKLFHLVSGDVDPRDFIHVPAGARLLDYGCGQAAYLRDFHDRGVAISGAEIAGYVVDACRDKGFDVHKVTDFSHIPFGDSEFDIVYLMQVFEHLRDPHRFMKELSRITKIGGTLYIAVPNSASLWRKIFGSNWVSGWFVPFHLVHYDRDMLAQLAWRNGFDLIESWSATPVMWFILNIKAWLYPEENQLDWHRNWLDSGPVWCLLMLILRIMELPFCERDCLVMVLKKRGSA